MVFVLQHYLIILLKNPKKRKKKNPSHLSIPVYVTFHLLNTQIIYFWLALPAACGLSLVRMRGELLFFGSAHTFYCSGFSCGVWALGHVGFSSCSTWILAHRLSSCGKQA